MLDEIRNLVEICNLKVNEASISTTDNCQIIYCGMKSWEDIFFPFMSFKLLPFCNLKYHKYEMVKIPYVNN